MVEDLNNYLKISVLTALVGTLSACSTFQGNTNNTKGLNSRCMAVVPMAVGEVDANILKTSAQVCKNPQSAKLWQQLAQHFFDIGKYDKAVQAANATLKLQPDNAVAKDIMLRSGLKITEKSLTQMKGNMQFLYGDAWSEASQVAGQISQARGEKSLKLQPATLDVAEMEAAKKAMAKKAPIKRAKKRQEPIKKAAPAAKVKAPAPKPASKPQPASKPKPSNPFSSFS